MENAWWMKSCSRVWSHGYNRRHERKIRLSHSDQVQGEIQKPPDVIWTRKEKYNEIELSKHLCQLEEENKEFTITWKILAKVKPYTDLTRSSNLCTTEKFFLIYRPHMATLSKRNELVSTCRHRRKFILRFNWTCQSRKSKRFCSIAVLCVSFT